MAHLTSNCFPGEIDTFIGKTKSNIHRDQTSVTSLEKIFQSPFREVTLPCCSSFLFSFLFVLSLFVCSLMSFTYLYCQLIGSPHRCQQTVQQVVAQLCCRSWLRLSWSRQRTAVELLRGKASRPRAPSLTGRPPIDSRKAINRWCRTNMQKITNVTKSKVRSSQIISNISISPTW